MKQIARLPNSKKGRGWAHSAAALVAVVIGAMPLSAAAGANAAAGLLATNLVLNGSCANTLGSFSTFTGTGPAASAATHWEVFNNVSAKTTTDILSNTQVHPPATMCHVVTTGDTPSNGNGMAQQWRASGGPAACTLSIWIYVVQGSVQVGVGNGGSTSATASDTTPGKWVQVTGHNSTSPCNEMTVYSHSAGIANDWYFHSATVTAQTTAA